MLLLAKVAISAAPLGTVAGVQFAAVFQSPVAGARFQVALPECALWIKLKMNPRERKR
jgi:hypothetical protein